MYKKSTLDNGVRVVSCPMQDRKSLAMGIWVGVGSRYEAPGIAGISHFLEHMVFKGTKNYTCQQIKESIEGVGGSFNGFTAEEATCYFVKIPSRYQGLALDILSDMVLSPLLKQEDIDKERTVILEEIKMYKDQPQSYVYELLDRLLWPKHPLGTSALGTNQTVNSIQNKELKQYLDTCYTGANIVVSTAGDIDHNDLVSKLKNKFRDLKKKKKNTCLVFKNSQLYPQMDIYHKDTEQTHLALGFSGLYRQHPLRYALGVANIILGANSSSRLFDQIREKRGLAYEIGTHVKYLKDTGAFIVHAGIDNQKAQDALKVILSELRRIKDDPVGLDELKRAKEFYIGQLTLALEDTLDQMLWMGDQTINLNSIAVFKDVVKKVQKVSIRDVRKVSQMIFQSRALNMSLIGPLKDQKSVFSKLIKAL